MIATMSTETWTYSTSTSGDLRLDVFRPSGEHRRCAVLVCHGGGWRSGAKEDVHDRALALTALGFTTIAVQYRLLDVAAWPSPLDDLRAALGWTRDHADDLDIDPGKIVVQGHSAGGHLALMSGTLPAEERPAAIAAYYAPIGFHRSTLPKATELRVEDIVHDAIGRTPSWMLFPPEVTAADLSAASPVELLTAHFPPTVLLSGTTDIALPPSSSIHFHNRLSYLGVPSALHLYAGRGHEFDRAPTMLACTSRDVALFLDCYVTDKKRIAREADRYPFPPQ